MMPRSFNGVESDLNSVATFIRLYTTQQPLGLA